MIQTVFVTSANPLTQQRAEILEFSWRRAEQPGELIRLVAMEPGDELPRHRHARVEQTVAWSPHPYTGDDYPPYNRAASLLEWLFRERPDGTILLLDPDSVLLSDVPTEVSAGRVIASPWPEFSAAEAWPLEPGSTYAFLERFGILRNLEPAGVTLPLLIHSIDLFRLAARWLELTGILREEARDAGLDADRLAYVVAAAEWGLVHEDRAFAVAAASMDAAAPILEEYEAHIAAGGEAAVLRPQLREGVREARVLDQMLLEIPGKEDTLTLNSSATAIWELCAKGLTVLEIAHELEARFEAPEAGLVSDVEMTLGLLEDVGAVDLVTDSP